MTGRLLKGGEHYFFIVGKIFCMICDEEIFD
jgi:hypothetical protein